VAFGYGAKEVIWYPYGASLPENRGRNVSGALSFCEVREPWNQLSEALCIWCEEEAYLDLPSKPTKKSEGTFEQGEEGEEKRPRRIQKNAMWKNKGDDFPNALSQGDLKELSLI